MRVEIDGKVVRIYGKRGVDLRIYYSEETDFDRFSLELGFNGLLHGCLPSVEVSGDKRIIITNTLEKGSQLYR